MQERQAASEAGSRDTVQTAVLPELLRGVDGIPTPAHREL